MDLPSGKSYPWYSLAFTGDTRIRIALYSEFEASVDREDDWAHYRDWIISHLGPFRSAIQPHIDRLQPATRSDDT